MKPSDKQVKVIVIAILLVIIGLMFAYPYIISSKTVTQPAQVNTSSQAIGTNTQSSTISNSTTTTVPTSTGYNLSFYVKILKDPKIGKIYYKGVPPFYSILLHGNISGNQLRYLGVTYRYHVLSLGDVKRNPSISVGDIVYNYYEPEKTPKGCDSYGFKVSRSNGEYYGDIVVSFCPYLYTSSSQIYIAGNATSNGLAGVVFFNWKQDKIFVLIEQEPLENPPVIGDWFLQAVYKKEYSNREPLAVRILLVNARPASLVDAYYNKDNRLIGVSLSYPNGTRITQLELGKIYIRRKLVYLDAVYDYTWYPTLAGVRTAYFPVGEYMLNINYTVSTRIDNKLLNTTLTYNDKIRVIEKQVETKTVTGILAVGGNQITMSWSQMNSTNTLNIQATGSLKGEITIQLRIKSTNGTVKIMEKQISSNEPITIELSGDIVSIEAQGTLPDNQSFKLTLPLKQ